MNKKNRQLAAVLAGLIVLFLIVRWVKSDKEVSSFKTQLFVLDTAQVQTIKLYPQTEQQAEIQFNKDIGNWTVSKDGIQSTVPNNRIQNLLSELQRIKPQRLAARTEDKWSTYQVDDSLGTRVVLEDQSGHELVDLVIGKFSYRQLPQQQQNPMMGGQPNIQAWTYVRNYDEVETYTTEGFLSMTFNQGFDSFRDKTLVKTPPGNITNVRIQTPESGSFTLQKLGNEWRMGDVIADSAKVATYLNQFRTLTGSEVDDRFSAGGTPPYQWTISGDNMADVSITAYPDGGQFKLRSSMNPSTTFTSDSTGVFSKIFKEPLEFLNGE